MNLFDFATWVFFGLIMAGIAIWLMKRRDRTTELLATGAVGGIIGGLIGLLFQGTSFVIGEFNVMSLVLAIAVSSLLVYAYWLLRYRYRPGEQG